MRVVFDSRPASDPNGVGRYSRCLLRALRETAALGDEITEARRPSVSCRGADVLHSPWMDGAMLHSPCPMVVTLHDLTALNRVSEHLRAGLRPRLRRLAMQRAISVIVPTAVVAGDAVRHLGVERERITVIPEAADTSMYARPEAEVAAVRARFSLPQEYLLVVGGPEHPNPRNHIAELAAAARELALVMVGRTRPWARELPGVTLTGEVSDEQLAALYSGARALVLPSENEGFGLPAVEALACGAPVVAFELPALREALGERATFVAPGDLEGLIAAAQEIRRPAPAPLRWTWEDAAHATWGVYVGVRRAVEQPRATRARHRRPGAAARRVDGLEPQ